MNSGLQVSSTLKEYTGLPGKAEKWKFGVRVLPQGRDLNQGPAKHKAQMRPLQSQPNGLKSVTVQSYNLFLYPTKRP